MPEERDGFLSPPVVELLQLAQTGCLRILSSLRDDVIRVEFRLERPNDPLVPFPSLLHRTPVCFAFDNAYPVTRMAAAVLGRRNFIELMWHGKEFPLWQEVATGWAAVTKEGRRLLSEFWPFFDPEDDKEWTQNATVFVKANWLVPGNIVRHPHSPNRFQVHDAASRDTVVQVSTRAKGGIEYFSPTDQIMVETESLMPGQRHLAAPMAFED